MKMTADLKFKDSKHSQNCSKNAGSRKDEDIDNDDIVEAPLPTDGGWGWAAVVGCILMHLCSGSTTRVFGVLLVAFQERFPESTTATLTSVSGCCVALSMFTGPITTMLMNKGVSARWILIMSGLISSVGAIMTAFVKVSWLLYVSFGVLVGTGIGLGYTASIVAIGQYFERRRPLAYGLTLLGNAGSGIILGPFYTFTLRELGFRGTWLIYGGVMLQMLVAGMLTKPMEKRRYRKKREIGETESEECEDKAHIETKESKERRINESKLGDNDMRTNRRENGGAGEDLATCEADKMKNNKLEDGEMCENDMHKSTMIETCEKNEMKIELEEQNVDVNYSSQTATKQSTERVIMGIRLSLLLDPMFMLFSLTYAIGCPCVYGQWAYLPSLALESGLTKNDAASLVVINSAASPLGTIVCTLITGAAGVRPHLPYLALGVLLLTAVADFLCSFAAAFLPFAFYAACSGFITMSYLLLRTISLQDMMGRGDLPSVYGIFNFLVGIGIVIVPIITGSLVDHFGTYKAPFLFFSASQVTATLTLALSIWIHRKRKSRSGGNMEK